MAGNYGVAGIRPGDSHGVFEVAATLNIPIFAGGKTHADVLEAEATLRQSRQQLENLRGQIDYEVRSARLDLTARLIKSKWRAVRWSLQLKRLTRRATVLPLVSLTILEVCAGAGGSGVGQ